MSPSRDARRAGEAEKDRGDLMTADEDEEEQPAPRQDGAEHGGDAHP